MKPKFEVGFDTETYYRKKDYSVGGPNALTMRQYCTDSRFNCYLASFAIEESVAKAYKVDVKGWRKEFYENPNGEKYVLYSTADHPKFIKWEQFDRATFVIHNATFDCNVLNRLIERGFIPRIRYDAVDTADMVAYLGVRRNLKDAMKFLLGEEISKEVRASMDGKMPSDLNEYEREALYQYGADDAVECYRLWRAFSVKWPEVEQKMSRLNREANIRGVLIDWDLVESGLDTLTKIRNDAESKLPWVNAENPEDRFPAGSLPALAKWLTSHGYNIPKSFNKSGNDFIDWRKTLDPVKDKEVIDVLDARIAVTGTNAHISRLETMLAQRDGDRLHPGFVYFGAHTGRFTAGVSEEAAGSKNLNLLNMTKKPVYGVDMRAMYIAGPGRKLVIADYSQVEARALLWLADDDDMCKALFDPSANLYQLTAVKMGWCKPEDDIKHNDPHTYQMAKQCVLGLGYGMATFTFLLRLEVAGIDVPSVPKEEWTDDDVSGVRFVLENQAFLDINMPKDWTRIGQVIYVRRIVERWRSANWRIAGRVNEETGFREGGFWRELYSTLIKSANAGLKKFWFTLPSGRNKVYYEPVKRANANTLANGKRGTYYMARTVQGGRSVLLNGGSLTENLVQAFCRDILVHAIVEIKDKYPQWEYLWNVYDEVVFSVPEDEADFALSEVSRIMCRGDYISQWTQGLPLGTEGCVSDHYRK